MLYLLPNLLDEAQPDTRLLPKAIDEIVATLDGLIAESERAGRRYLKRFVTKKPLQQMPLRLLNEHTEDKELKELLEPLQRGEAWGLVSDSGLPCIADPGARLVALARQCKVPVQAFMGPNSILLALMLSGMSGQRFAFHGYLPKEEKERRRQVRYLEEEARKCKNTHIFIETPYHTEALLRELLEILGEKTLLCVAIDVTMPTERVTTMSVGEWRKTSLPEINKRLVVFLFCV
jgi:16S rRNA (cytidine1402-2'-O)-methyltransferase